MANELYSFNALISENELKFLMQLNDITTGDIDFMNTTDGDIKNLIK